VNYSFKTLAEEA